MTEPSTASTPEELKFQRRMQAIETLIQGVERYPDLAARTHTKAIVQALLDLHGAAMERILERATKEGEAGLALIDALARDELVGSLLLLYGLHPLTLETRVRQALDKVRPIVQSHGGSLELLAADEGLVRLRLRASGEGCASNALTLKQAIDDSIYARAPDVSAIEVEGLSPHGKNGHARIALPIL
jgi:Fe-S cluster biogenesis protein NfuA